MKADIHTKQDPIDKSRCAIAIIDNHHMVNIIKGLTEISGLPDDAQIHAVEHMFHRDAFALRILSESFDKVPLGNMAPTISIKVKTKIDGVDGVQVIESL